MGVLCLLELLEDFAESANFEAQRTRALCLRRLLYIELQRQRSPSNFISKQKDVLGEAVDAHFKCKQTLQKQTRKFYRYLLAARTPVILVQW